MDAIELIKHISKIDDINTIVSLLILCTDKLEINTISEMARIENKTPRGILVSNQYKKINIGKQKFAIKGVKEDDFPF